MALADPVCFPNFNPYLRGVELQKKDIRKLSLPELEEFFLEQGDKKFRAKQVYEWLWSKSLKNFDEMSNISLSTRELLKTHFTINHIRVDLMQHSSDGTIKIFETVKRSAFATEAFGPLGVQSDAFFGVGGGFLKKTLAGVASRAIGEPEQEHGISWGRMLRVK